MEEIKPCPFCGKVPRKSDYADLLSGITSECICDGVFGVGEWSRRPIEDALTARIADLEAQLAAVPKWTRITDDQLAELQDGTPLWIVYEGFYVSHTQAQIEEDGATEVEWGDFVGHFTPPQAKS